MTPVRYVEPVASRRSRRHDALPGGPRVRSVAVLGAGTMGAQIAAHFANAGVPALLLDLDADVARAGLKRAHDAQARSVLHARHARADPHRRLRDRPAAHRGVRLDHRGRRRAARRQARAARASRRAHDARARIVSSNTSGIPIAALAEGRSRRLPAALARHALLQSAALSAPARGHPDAGHRSRRSSTTVARFADHRLGKGVVIAKDTPDSSPITSASTA